MIIRRLESGVWFRLVQDVLMIGGPGVIVK